MKNWQRFLACRTVRETGGEIPVPEEVLVASLNDFLGSLRENEANIFMQRYYFLRSAKDIAAAHGLKENHVRSILAKTRSKLNRFLKSVISEM